MMEFVQQTSLAEKQTCIAAEAHQVRRDAQGDSRVVEVEHAGPNLDGAGDGEEEVFLGAKDGSVSDSDHDSVDTDGALDWLSDSGSSHEEEANNEGTEEEDEDEPHIWIEQPPMQSPFASRRSTSTSCCLSETHGRAEEAGARASAGDHTAYTPAEGGVDGKLKQVAADSSLPEHVTCQASEDGERRQHGAAAENGVGETEEVEAGPGKAISRTEKERLRAQQHQDVAVAILCTPETFTPGAERNEEAANHGVDAEQCHAHSSYDEADPSASSRATYHSITAPDKPGQDGSSCTASTAAELPTMEGPGHERTDQNMEPRIHSQRDPGSSEAALRERQEADACDTSAAYPPVGDGSLQRIDRNPPVTTSEQGGSAVREGKAGPVKGGRVAQRLSAYAAARNAEAAAASQPPPLHGKALHCNGQRKISSKMASLISMTEEALGRVPEEQRKFGEAMDMLRSSTEGNEAGCAAPWELNLAGMRYVRKLEPAQRDRTFEELARAIAASPWLTSVNLR